MSESPSLPNIETWESAVVFQGGKLNPALQMSCWEFARADFSIVARLSHPLAHLADRLKLTVESTWEDLGYVDVSMFRLGILDFALSTYRDGAPETLIWLRSGPEDDALDALLYALGLDRGSLIA